MHASTPRILFVSHEASRTGAPIFLLHLLRWLRDHTDVEFETVLRRGGPLLDEFAAAGPLHLLDDRRPDSWAARAERHLGKGPLREPALAANRALYRRRASGLSGFDVLYLNSAVSAGALRVLPTHRTLVVSHIHELETQLEHSLPRPGDREALFDRTDRWIAAADCVKDCLVDVHGVPAELVERHYELVAAPEASPGDPALRARLGIPEDALVVGAMGTIEPRKGPDLFLALAKQVADQPRGRRVHFLWIGNEPTGPQHWPMAPEIRRAGLERLVHLTGEMAKPQAALSLVDVFALTSREDPFPLACLEAAALGIPLVTFANGGMAEFLRTGGGAVVPHLHVGAMAQEVGALLDDDGLRKRTGAQAARQVREHHDVAVAAPRILRTLLDWAAAA